MRKLPSLLALLQTGPVTLAVPAQAAPVPFAQQLPAAPLAPPRHTAAARAEAGDVVSLSDLIAELKPAAVEHQAEPKAKPEQTTSADLQPDDSRALTVETAQVYDQQTKLAALADVAKLTNTVATITSERDAARRCVASLERSHVDIMAQLASERMESTLLRSQLAAEIKSGAACRLRLEADRADQAEIITDLRAQLAGAPLAPLPVVRLETIKAETREIVVAFRKGEQTALLRAAGMTVDDLKNAGFRFMFNRNSTDRALSDSAGAWRAPFTLSREQIADRLVPVADVTKNTLV
jgi:hypothetical protein